MADGAASTGGFRHFHSELATLKQRLLEMSERAESLSLAGGGLRGAVDRLQSFVNAEMRRMAYIDTGRPTTLSCTLPQTSVHCTAISMVSLNAMVAISSASRSMTSADTPHSAATDSDE